MDKKKNLVWTLITVIIAVISIWSVISQAHHFSLENFGDFITGSNPGWMCLAVFWMIFYIFMEGHALQNILRAFGYRRRWINCTVYSAADIYFSAITPSATGGQPASAFFMMLDNLPAAVVTIALLLNLALYTISIMTVGILALIIRPEIFINFNGFSKFLIVTGYVILTLLAVFFILLVRYEQILNKICLRLIRLLNKLHIIKNTKRYEDKLNDIIDEYRKCSKLLDGKKKRVIAAFVCNFLQRFVQICIPATVVLAMERSFDNAVSVWITQVFVTIGSNCVPIPGAQGVSDYLLLDGLGVMMGNDVAINLDLLSRCISFYGCIIVSIIIVAIAYAYHMKHGSMKKRFRFSLKRKQNSEE